MGPARKILGIKFSRDRAKKVLHLFQRGYIKKVLERFRTKKVKPTNLPLAGHFRLSRMMSLQTEVEAQEMERVPYASGVRSFVYAMMCCRLDITHAVSQISRFMVQPSREH